MHYQIDSYECAACRTKSKHITVLVRKPSPFSGSIHRKYKEFIAGLIKGWAVGPFLASMDEFSRHTICERCGHKTIEKLIVKFQS